MKGRLDSPRPRWASLAAMALVVGILSSLATPPRAAAASGGARLWVKRYNGPGNGDDAACCVTPSPDGSTVFVTGYSLGSTGSKDYTTVANDASTGATLWVDRYNGPGNGDDEATALGVSPDGSRVFVTGSSGPSYNADDYATAAYDATTGAELWVNRYNGPALGHDGAAALAVAANGMEVVVTGASEGTTTRLDYATVAYDASTGAKLWTRRYHGPGNGDDQVNSIVASPDGSRVFVTGDSIGSTESFDYATVAYDASSGTRLWVARYNGPADGEDVATSITASPNGSEVFVTGRSQGTSSCCFVIDYATLAYTAASGDALWVKRYAPRKIDESYPSAVAASPDGSKVFVTGGSGGGRTLSHYATVAYDATTGAELWAKGYRGPGGGPDVALSVAPSPTRSEVFVTGFSNGGATTGFDYATVAWDADTGARLWVRRYSAPGAGDDEAFSVASSPDGSKVFVTGESTGGAGSHDYTTVAYAA